TPLVQSYPNTVQTVLFLLVSQDSGTGLAHRSLDRQGTWEKCWNLLGKCRHTCFKKERIYVYCTNSKPCCVKPKYHPKQHPW
uniref:Beta-defensin n=1 Tax=Myotis lucifugus TaxID=59463 RepID=G1Q5Y6_MYOLU